MAGLTVWASAEVTVLFMKVRDIIKLLERDGWFLKQTRGSHRQYKHPTKAGRVTLPGHPNDDSSAGYSEQRFQTSRVESMNYVVIYEKSATGWAAYVPDLPGVVTTGPTRSEVRSLIQQAIEFHLDGLKEDRLPIPEPSAEAEIISVSQR
jgi:predicted RNA binding protein YcfA (HicA-like mRNA interferase family)/predicted RNase H-like HicB family nuclease